MGWIHRRRDFGPLIILTLRDRDGDTQLTIDETSASKETYEFATTLRAGSCIGVRGQVIHRTERGGEVNPKMATGEIELLVEEITLFSQTEPLPFEPDGKDKSIETSELLRLQHRYIDLRRQAMVRNMTFRSKLSHLVHNYFNDYGFLNIETPLLMKSTPEGARDFLVPSRLEPTNFYALPQSPQIYKQILMMGGMDRYYQISRCFRDEDLRADRQPEFTQIDFEMSFATREGIFALLEGFFQRVFQELMDTELPIPFARMTYDEAVETYGEDKPDLRYELPLQNLTEVFANTGFGLFKGVIDAGGQIKCLVLPGKDISNGAVKKYEAVAKRAGAGGLGRFRWKAGAWDSPIAKHLSEDEQAAMAAHLSPEDEALVLVVADKQTSTVNKSLSTLRRHLADVMNLVPQEPTWRFLWITDFPLVEYVEEDERYYAVSHPFTQPNLEDLHHLETDPTAIRSQSYDLVLNGVELGSGSIRIHDTHLQMQMLELLGFTKESAQAQFGFLLEALKYGPPPHGGAALGLDRIVMQLLGEQSLRDVIAFPKTQSGGCPMSGAPSAVDNEQLAELMLCLKNTRPETDPKA